MKKSPFRQLSADLHPRTLEKQGDSRDRPCFAQHEQRDKDDTIDEIDHPDSLAVGVRMLQLTRRRSEDRQPRIFPGEQPGITRYLPATHGGVRLRQADVHGSSPRSQQTFRARIARESVVVELVEAHITGDGFRRQTLVGQIPFNRRQERVPGLRLTSSNVVGGRNPCAPSKTRWDGPHGSASGQVTVKASSPARLASINSRIRRPTWPSRRRSAAAIPCGLSRRGS